MSVCLSTYTSQKSHFQTSQNFLCTLTVGMAWFSSDDTIITLCTFGFVDDIIFAHNWPGKGNPLECKISDSLGLKLGAKSDTIALSYI